MSRDGQRPSCYPAALLLGLPPKIQEYSDCSCYPAACLLGLPPKNLKYRLQTSIQSKVIGILWKVGGNRRRRGNGSCCPAASGTSGWLLFELELLGCHNTYELTVIRIRLWKTWAAIWLSGGPCGTAGTSVQHNFRITDRLRPDWLARIPVASKADLHWFAGRTCWIAATCDPFTSAHWPTNPRSFAASPAIAKGWLELPEQVSITRLQIPCHRCRHVA